MHVLSNTYNDWVVSLDHQANTNNRHDCYYNNIFCSELFRNKVCSIVLSDATDHMPIFVLCDNSTNVVNHEDPSVKYKRKLDEDLLNRLELDLNDVNWETEIQTLI